MLIKSDNKEALQAFLKKYENYGKEYEEELQKYSDRIRDL